MWGQRAEPGGAGGRFAPRSGRVRRSRPRAAGPSAALPGPRGAAGPRAAQRPRTGRSLSGPLSPLSPVPHLSSSGSSSMARPPSPAAAPQAQAAAITRRPPGGAGQWGGRRGRRGPRREEPGRCEPGPATPRWAPAAPVVAPPAQRRAGAVGSLCGQDPRAPPTGRGKQRGAVTECGEGGTAAGES